jgi:DNA polymerase III subunit delta
MSSPAPIAFVFYGADEPTLKQKLKEFCAKAVDAAAADFNTSKLDGSSTNLGDIQMAAGSLPFLSETRLILIENITESNGGRAMIDEIATLLPSLPDWARVVFVETGLQDSSNDTDSARKRKTARRTALKRLVQVVENDARGKVYEHPMPGDPRKWLSQQAVLHGATIEPAAATVLAERVGEDLVLADTELAKLSAYTNNERAISAADVKLLTPFTPEANIFHMVDAIGQRDGRRALTLFRQLMEAGDEPMRLFSMIVRQFRLLVMVREHLDNGGSPGNAGQALGMNDFVAKKVAEQARRYNIEQLERIYRYLLETDLSMKGGALNEEEFGKTIDRLDPAFALEEFIVRLAAR